MGDITESPNHGKNKRKLITLHGDELLTQCKSVDRLVCFQDGDGSDNSSTSTIGVNVDEINDEEASREASLCNTVFWATVRPGLEEKCDKMPSCTDAVNDTTTADIARIVIQLEIARLERREATLDELWAHEQHGAVELRAQLTALKQQSGATYDALKDTENENVRTIERLKQRIERLNSEVSGKRQVMKGFDQQRVAWQSKLESLTRENQLLRSTKTLPNTSRLAGLNTAPGGSILDDLRVLWGDESKHRQILRLVHPDKNITAHENVLTASRRILERLNA